MKRIILLTGVLVLVACEDVTPPTASIPAPDLSVVREITAIDLGSLGGTYTEAMVINEAGQVAGISGTPSLVTHAFLWDGGVMRDLGSLGDNVHDVRAINSSGQVVGRSETSSGRMHAFFWDGAMMHDLGPPGFRFTTSAIDVNDVGQVLVSGGPDGPFLWHEGTTTTIGGLAAEGNSVRDLNELGQVVGTSIVEPFVARAFLWQSGVVTDLGTLGGAISVAWTVNNLGQVAGYTGEPFQPAPVLCRPPCDMFRWESGVMASIGPGVPSRVLMNDLGQIVARNSSSVFFWDGAVHELGTLGGHTTEALAMNDVGHVVGRSSVSSGARHAFFWNGELFDLGTEGESESIAFDINNNGQIVGSTIGVDGLQSGRLWTVSLRPATPQEETAILRDLIPTLVDGGSLNMGQGNALGGKLDAIDRQLEKGNQNAAANLFQAFINQVQAYINAGVLSQEEGNELIDAAQNAISQLDT